MKKIISIFMMFALIFSLNIPVFASEKEPENQICNEEINLENDEVVYLSEYDMIKNLQTMEYDELVNIGYTDEQIQELEMINFEKIVEDARSKGYEYLKDEGYTDEEIQIIYSDDLEAAARVLSAELTLTCGISRFYYSSASDRTTIDTEFSWTWDKCPTLTLTDIIGMTISNDMYLDDSNVIVRYYENGDWDSYSQTKTYTMKRAAAVSFAQCTFDINLFNEPSVDPPEVALEGEGTCSWQLDGELTQAAILVKYGHSTVKCSPSISLGDAGFSFGFQPIIVVDTVGEDDDYAER